MTLTGNEPAFPIDGVHAHSALASGYLTIRQQFAAMAMWSTANPHNSYESGKRAEWALIEANALINELNKQP